MSTPNKTILLALVASAIVLAGNVAHAQNWSSDPTINNPIVVTNGGQDYAPNDRPIASDGNGGAVIAWVDMRSGSSNDIFAQRIGADGSVKWGPNGIIICNATMDQSQPRVAEDSGGSTFIVWQDFRNGIDTDIYVQKVDGTGNVLWTANGIGVCIATGDQRNPRVIADGNFGCIVTWEDYRNFGTTGVDIFAMRLDSTGAIATGWSANGMPVCQASGDQTNPRMISDGVPGGSLIVWQDTRNGVNNSDICAQRMAPNGAQLWAPNGNPVCLAIGNQIKPVLVSDNSSPPNGAIIAWEDYRGADADIYVETIMSSGSVLWDVANKFGIAMCAAGGPQTNPRIAPSGLGNAIVVWEDGRIGNDIYAQMVISTGAMQWGANGTPICSNAAAQSSPDIMPENAGAIVTWQDQRDGVDNIYAYKVNSGGTKVWGSPDGSMPVCKAGNVQQIPKLTKDGAGGAIVVWVDLRGGTDSDLYAQRILTDGSLPGPMGAWILSASFTPTKDPAAGNPPGSFNPSGGAAGVGEGVTGMTFDWATAGLTVEADIRTPTIGSSFSNAWIGIDSVGSADGTRGANFTGIYVDAMSTGMVFFYFNGGSIFSQSIPDTAYHNYRILIRADDFVEFYVDGVIRTTSGAVWNTIYNNKPVTVGGQSSGSNVRVDNVIVKTLGGMILFQDAFNAGGPPAAPTLPNQYRTTSQTPIAVGGGTNETQVDLKAASSDGEVGDTFKIQFEVRPIATPFASPANVVVDNVVFFESAASASNTMQMLIKTIMGLSPGQYHWQCRAIDSAGNVTIWVGFGGNVENPPTNPAGVDFFVDTIPPNTTITGGPPPTVNTTTAVFTFTSTESGSFERNLDGSGWISLSPPETLTGLSNGSHTYLVRAVDPVGNIDPTPASWSWTIDTVAPLQPTLTLDPASDTGISNGDRVTSIVTPTLTGTADPGASVIIYRNGVSFTSTSATVLGTFAVTLPALPDGTVGLTAVAIDAAGNVGPSSTLLGIIIDTTPPVAGGVRDGAGVDIDLQPDLTFLEANWGGFSDVGGIAWYEWALGTTPGGTDIQPFTNIGPGTAGYRSGLTLTPGATYYATVRAVDLIGLFSPTATSNGVLVTLLNPPTNLVAVPGDAQIALSWDPVPGATSYRVYYGDAIGNMSGVGAAEGPSPIAASTNSLTMTGLVNMTTYYIVVTAVMPAGMESPPSRAVFATPGSSGAFTFVRTVPGGSSPDVYRMISFPLISADLNPMNDLFDDLGPYDPTVWRMFAFNPFDGLYHEYGSPGFPPPQPGRAYWIITRGPATLDVVGYPADKSQDFVLTLQPGWNMIGHPFPFPVIWHEAYVNGVRIGDPGDNGYVGEFLWDWVGGYLQVPQLMPSRGYWVYNRSTSPVDLRIPPIASPPGPVDRNAKPVMTADDLRTSGDDIPPLPPGAQSADAGGGGGGGGGGGCFIATTESKRSDGRAIIVLLLILLAAVALRRKVDVR